MVIRPATKADAAGIARVHIDTWRTTYRGIVPDERLDRADYEAGRATWEKNVEQGEGRFVLVAEVPGEGVVGFAAGGPERSGDATYRGEVYALYVLKAHQRKGIGRRLVMAAAEELRRRGLDSLLIWVLARNPYRAFYEALGGKELRSQTIEIAGRPLEEVAYGWPDTKVLA
ncbi:MAG: GNAT family N-acetyltransferase [Firmicutes bacterium]|nr:GNAT family N-acetyltransferase [Bacillota bacterium]